MYSHREEYTIVFTDCLFNRATVFMIRKFNQKIRKEVSVMLVYKPP